MNDGICTCAFPTGGTCECYDKKKPLWDKIPTYEDYFEPSELEIENGGYVLYKDHKRIVGGLTAALRDIANINAMDYEDQEWARAALKDLL